MKFTPSLEAMQAVPQSKLGVELEKLFQEVIDYRDNSLKGVGFSARAIALQSFFGKKIARRFMDIVYKNTGLNIEAVFFKGSFETQFCTWICIQKGDELTARGTQQITSTLNGQASEWITAMMGGNEFTVDELIALAKSYDVEKGIIKPAHREQIKKIVRCAIGFDIALGFLSVDYLPKNSGAEYLTARELTAIMLHEIGHNLTLVEHAADLYARAATFRALEAYFKKTATVEKSIGLAKRVANIAASNGYQKDAAALLAAATQAEKDYQSTGQRLPAPTKASFIESTVGSAFYLLGIVLSGTLDVLISDNTRTFLRLRAGQKKKLADLPVSERMWTWQERKADEYAFTHGYGADQVTALEKITNFYGMIGKSEKDLEAMQQAETKGKSLGIFAKLRLLFWAMSTLGDFCYRSYPPTSERYREILNHTVRELKIHGASGEYVAKYIKDIETILTSIDNISKSDKYFELAQKKYRLFLKYVSLKSFVAWFTNGRAEQELEELMSDIRQLSDNLLGYFEAKLKQIAENKS